MEVKITYNDSCIKVVPLNSKYDLLSNLSGKGWEFLDFNLAKKYLEECKNGTFRDDTDLFFRITTYDLQHEILLINDGEAYIIEKEREGEAIFSFSLDLFSEILNEIQLLVQSQK